MRISDWSSDVCSSDLQRRDQREVAEFGNHDGTTTPVSASVWHLTPPSVLPTRWAPATTCGRGDGLAPAAELNGAHECSPSLHFSGPASSARSQVASCLGRP